MKVWTPEIIQNRISEVLPEGRVIPRHTVDRHYYEVREGDLINEPVQNADGTPNIVGPVYPSVTGKLQILKDEGLMNWKMNQAINHVFTHYKSYTDENIMQMLEDAKNVSGGIFKDAGAVGTRIHDYREKIFVAWLQSGEKPADFLSFIPEDEVDFRCHSAIRALQAFVNDYDYEPVACELLVYNHEFKVAGTLDDIGLMRQYERRGAEGCAHEVVVDKRGWHRCMKCDAKWRKQFVLLDLKSSNAFKDHYFFQVSIYHWFFKKLMGITPERDFILKVSKDDGTYKIEDLKYPARIAQYARAMLKTNEGIEFIKSLRTDNQKVVAPLMDI